MKKRILSLFVCLCLLLSLSTGVLCGAGFAADRDEGALMPQGGDCIVEVYVTGPQGSGTAIGGGIYSYGETVTVKAIPAMGFALFNWSGSGDAVVSREHDYSFTVTADTVLFANFVEAPFNDICSTDYYYNPVVWAVEEAITTGTSETTFSPAETCTRAQVVTFLWRSAGSPMPHSTESPFVDVTGGEYYYDAVMWAVGSGITTGTSANTFSPNESCTRAQVVTFLWRACGQPTAASTSNPFVDIDADAYYYDAVLWAVEQNITTGTSETTFSPDESCTRGQIVTFLYRAAGGDYVSLFISDYSPDPWAIPGAYVDLWVSAAGGTAPYSYQWQYTYDDMGFWIDFTDEAWAVGALTDTLNIRVDTDDFFANFKYRCVITDAGGDRITSDPMQVISDLWIRVQPTDVFCKESDTAIFSVEAYGGAAPYTYQWQYIHDNASDWINFTDEAWAMDYFTDTVQVIISADDFAYNYRYRCVVTDGNGTVVCSEDAGPLYMN